MSAESAYTTLDLDACSVLETYEEGVGVALQCDGWQGVPVFVAEGDLRFSVSFGVPQETWSSFGPFNSLGETVEWRISGGEASAAILRFRLDSGLTGTAEDRGQVLAAFKVGRDGSPGCVIGAVDASVEQPNGVARGIAALASQFDCGTDTAVTIGPDDSHVHSLTGSRPE